jgi:hypothetical protein
MGTMPPLAGLCTYEDADRSELAVDEAVRLLRRLARIEQRTLLVLAAQLNAVPEWEAKCALSLHLWQDAEHCGWLRERVTEMRKPPHFLDRPDDDALETFFDELIRAASTRELLTGVYAVLKPRLVEAVAEHSRRLNPLADQPTLRLLRFVLVEEREQVEWGARALAAIGGADDDWQRHLEGYLSAAGGILGDRPRTNSATPARSSEPLELVRTPQRDERFTRLWDSRGHLPGYDAPPDEVKWRMLYVRLTEMHVPELLALTLYEWPDATFDVHRDLARHLWDEARHAMMGEVAFEREGVDWHTVPHELSFAAYPNARLEPRARYALLYRAEHAVMGNTPIGKRAQHAAALASGDTLAALFQDYDWADEVLHVHIARKVLAGAYDAVEDRDAASAHAWDQYEQILECDRALDRAEWWPAFYASIQSREAHPSPAR